MAIAQLDSTQKKTLQAVYVDQKPKIDGILDDAVWQLAPVAHQFTELSPNPYSQPSQPTEVRILYTTEGIYIGAKLLDSAPDSILKQLSIRDETNNVNADIFTVYIDGMLTQQTSFEFAVTSAGVQIDKSDGDALWDAVWKSSVNLVADGWIVEMEIPYSQLRFPKSKKQTWGINFSRNLRRSRERFFWASIDPTNNNQVQQYGLLQGIEKINPPVRLSLTPYVAGYLNHTQDNDPSTPDWTPNFSAGADLKYGINESFTLDVSLVPDFGDIQSDNVIFNLSPFEVYYAERRPFFTEGVNLFNKANLFYSRRIGSLPDSYRAAYDEAESDELVIKNPQRPYLINALKISGRTKNGLGLGLFNAVTAPAFAQLQDTLTSDIRKYQTEGFTNYNVIVADQQFWKHSSISLINTSVVRFGGYTDAIATGTEFKIADKKNIWGVAGSGAYSHRFLDTSRHDRAFQNGYRYDVSFNKFSGNLTWNIGQSTMSKDYNINDMGFVGRANYVNSYANVWYNTYQPKGAFLNTWSNVNLQYNRLYNPSKFTSLAVSGNLGGTLRNFLSIQGDMKVEPMGNNDYFEARTPNRVWAKPLWTRVGAWFSSDYRKVFALDGDFSYRRFWGQGAWQGSDVIGAGLKPLVRFSDQLNMTFSTDVTWRRNSLGYVTKNTLAGQEAIIFGSRQRQDVENILTANYLFTNKIALSLRVRHYWARVIYTDFWQLGDAGTMDNTNYTGHHDSNYNAFNVDLIFRWRFAPGSELNIVWKNAVLSYDNEPRYDYFNNFGNMFESGQSNQFSIKALYYLDFFQVMGSKKNRGIRLD